MNNNEQRQHGNIGTWPWVAVAVIVLIPNLLPNLGMWWGPAIGTIGGLIGGAIGCYVGIKRTELPEERRLMIRVMALVFLLMVGSGAGFVLGFLLFSGYYCFLVFPPFGLGLFLLVRYANRKRREIFAEVQADDDGASPGV